ncbi:acyltransferase family protein [Pseudoalteromonas fenneropenaei]|uniref:Acyltransferase family protein n=1 Tax=Pseudoalteromonas fenneropenaei TaxID=1737459 RepID=A0ABV7CNV0_9GAMM
MLADKTRQPGLDFLRAFAIIWVMLFHTGTLRIEMPIAVFSNLGWMGVDLFFVLSGFLIARQLFRFVATGQSISLSQFYLSRALRILPAFLVVLGCYFVFPAIQEGRGLPALWQFFTFTVNLFVDLSTNTFSHVWSLCVEEHFYLVFPLLAMLLRGKHLATKVIVVCLVIMIAGAFLRSQLWHADWVFPFGKHYMMYLYYPTYSRLDGLVAGVMLAALAVFMPKVWSKVQAHNHWVMGVGLVGMSVSIWLFQDRLSFIATVLGFPILAISFAFIVAAASSAANVLGPRIIPVVSFIAAISYSLYLTHKAVFFVVKTHLNDWATIHPVVAFAIYSGAALVVASLLYFAIERPFLRLRSRFFQPTEAALVNQNTQTAS